MIGYVKHFGNGNNTMSFNASDNKLFKKYNKLWEKVSSLMDKKSNSELVYGDKYIKTTIKSYGGKIKTNFQGKKIPKGNTAYKCLSLIVLASVIRTHKKYHP